MAMASPPTGSFPDRGPVVFAVTTATLVLSSTFVFARMVCRIGIVRRFGYDDYFIALAWILAFGLCFTIDLGTQNGLGRHSVDIPPEDQGTLRKCEYVFSILYNPALMSTKTSILIFYLRLSKNTQKLLRLGSYIVLVVVNVGGLVLSFLNIFQCRPIHAAFSDTLGQCIPLLTEFICSAPVNIVTDLAILALPIPVLTGMRLPSRQKTILVITFALGIFVTVVDVVRIYYLQQAITVIRTGTSDDPSSIFGDSANFSWNASFSLMWSAVEVNVGIACACVPTLKPLIIKILPAMILDRYGSGSRSLHTCYPGSSYATSCLDTVYPNMSSLRKSIPTSVPPEAQTHRVSSAVPEPGVAPAGNVMTDVDMITASCPSLPEAHAPDYTVDQSLDLSHNGIATADHAAQSLAATVERSEASRQAGQQDDLLSDCAHLASVPLCRHRARTASSRASRAPINTDAAPVRADRRKSIYFGFVNLDTPKTMLEASVSESTKYCTIVAILFFLWGFSYGLLNTLNDVVATVANMTTLQTLGLTSAYFGGGYFFGPLIFGRWILRRDDHHHRFRQEPDATHQQDQIAAYGERTWADSAASRHTSSVTHLTKQSHWSRLSHHSHTSHCSHYLHGPRWSHHTAPEEEHIGGFKATFIVGLCWYGVGTIMFWPCAVVASFAGFLISSFVVGFGLGILETAANPFIAMCGPMEYSEMRLLLVQAAQGIGSVLSGLLAQNVFFVDVSAENEAQSTALLDVQWTYLAITLFCAALTMFFYYIPLPELHEAELRVLASRLPVDGKKRSIFGLQLRTICLAMAVFAQWAYVACQESMSIYFQGLLMSWLPDSGDGQAFTTSSNELRSVVLKGLVKLPSLRNAMATSTTALDRSSDHPVGLVVSIPNYMLISRTAFTVSRFFTAYLVYLGVKHPKNRWLPTPRTILMISVVSALLLALVIVLLEPSRNANLITIPTTLYFLAEGPVWPLIFAIGLRGQGARTKSAAAYITMGASGPLFWPFVMYAIVENGDTVRLAFVVVVGLMAVCTMYPLFLTFVCDARELTKATPLNPETTSAAATAVEPEDGSRASMNEARGGSSSPEISQCTSGRGESNSVSPGDVSVEKRSNTVV